MWTCWYGQKDFWTLGILSITLKYAWEIKQPLITFFFMIADPSRSLHHKIGTNRDQCRNESQSCISWNTAKLEAYIHASHRDRRGSLSTVLFMWGPLWSKQVIRHKEADSVCFDGARQQTWQYLPGLGLVRSAVLIRWRGSLRGDAASWQEGFTALHSTLSRLHFRGLRETRYIDSQMQKPQRQHPPRCRASSTCRGGVWGGAEGGRGVLEWDSKIWPLHHLD